MTERDPTVHAATGLALQLVDVLVLVDLTPVLQPDRHGATGGQLAFASVEKALGVSHGTPP